MAAKNDLTLGSIPSLFRKLAIPSAIGMVFTTLYNVVDVYYAGLLSTDAQAGLAISFQVFFILITLGFGLGTGMSALVGNKIGANDEAGARETAAQGLSYSVLVSVVFTFIGFWIGPLLIALISEPGAYRDAANAYLSLLMVGVISFILSFGANGILNAQGDMVSMQRAQIGAFFANLILNPLFIFGIPGLWDGIGFNGIALSTVVSQMGVMIFILIRVFKSDLMSGWRWSDFKPIISDYKEITGQALPVSFSMLVMMLAGFMVQYFLKGFGGEAVAAYGVALRIEQLMLLPVFGLTGALLPITAQNFGAGQFDRVREAAFFCFKIGGLMMLGGALVLWIFGGMLLGIFSDDPDVIEIGRSYLYVDGALLPVYMMLFGLNSLLQAFKKPIWTLWIGIYRQGLGVGLFSYFFVVIMGAGYWGVWFGIALSVVTGLLFSIWATEHVARQKIGGLFLRSRELIKT